MPISSVRTDHELLNDFELVALAVGGDPSAFTPLMRRYNRTLYRAARSILKDDAEAEDAVQETYLLAYRNLAAFRSASTLRTWLTSIVVNAALARRRKMVRTAEIISLDGDMEQDLKDTGAYVANDQDQPEVAMLRTEMRAIVERKIDELPEAIRTVFVLRVLEEMSVEEVANVLGIPQPTVRTRHFRGRSLLRESLSRELDIAVDDAFRFDGERCDRIVANVMKRLYDTGPGTD